MEKRAVKTARFWFFVDITGEKQYNDERIMKERKAVLF